MGEPDRCGTCRYWRRGVEDIKRTVYCPACSAVCSTCRHAIGEELVRQDVYPNARDDGKLWSQCQRFQDSDIGMEIDAADDYGLVLITRENFGCTEWASLPEDQ